MKTHISIFAIFSLLLFSCKKDRLDETIFIPDEDNFELPAYTEWGYNAFGAVYELETINSRYNAAPCKIVYKNGALDFSLIGRISNFKAATLTFSFPLLPEVKTIFDLDVLHDLTVNLAENCTVTLEVNDTQITLEDVSGKLHFKRFQLLRVDEKINRIILSGIFDLTFKKNELSETISDGRFDMGITEKDFYYSK